MFCGEFDGQKYNLRGHARVGNELCLVHMYVTERDNKITPPLTMMIFLFLRRSKNKYVYANLI
jgi:hypothetical protein